MQRPAIGGGVTIGIMFIVAGGDQLRAAMSLAGLWRDQGKPQQARELLAPVYGWFKEGFGTRAHSTNFETASKMASAVTAGFSFGDSHAPTSQPWSRIRF
jgi:hypothetical protein